MKKSNFLISLGIISAFMIVASSFTFSAFGLQFAHKTMWGGNGVANGQFKQANGIAIDSKDNVYVGDFAAYTTKMIQKFTPNGTFVSGFGSYGNGPIFYKSIRYDC